MRITLLFKITCKSLIYKAYKDILRKEISRAKLSVNGQNTLVKLVDV